MPDLDLTRPFTTAQALAAGLTPGQLRSRRFRRLHHRVHVLASSPETPALRARAALLLHTPEAHVGFALAAELLGVPVPKGMPVVVIVPRESDRRRHAALRCVVRRSDAHVRDGLAVATPEALFMQLAEVLGFVDLVVAGDAMLHQRLSTVDRLRRAAETSAHPGARRALRTLPWLRRGAESPPETRLRLLLQLAGLPFLDTQVELRDHDGTLLRRYDLGHRRSKVAVAYDGRQHVEVVAEWEKDLDRRDISDDLEWRVVTVIAKGINREPERTIDRVVRALRQRGVYVGPLRAEWRRFFGYGSQRNGSAPNQIAGFDDPNPTF